MINDAGKYEVKPVESRASIEICGLPAGITSAAALIK